MNPQQLVFAFYVLQVFPTGATYCFHRKGKSFVANADASGATFTMHDSVDAAMKWAREMSVYIWNNNDRVQLVQEYGLTRDDVQSFMGYVWSEDYKFAGLK